MAEVTGFDLEGRRVQLAEGSLPYDTLIVSGGSHYSYFGHDDWRIYAPEVKSLESAKPVAFGGHESAEVRQRSWSIRFHDSRQIPAGGRAG